MPETHFFTLETENHLQSEPTTVSSMEAAVDLCEDCVGEGICSYCGGTKMPARGVKSNSVGLFDTTYLEYMWEAMLKVYFDIQYADVGVRCCAGCNGSGKCFKCKGTGRSHRARV